MRICSTSVGGIPNSARDWGGSGCGRRFSGLKVAAVLITLAFSLGWRHKTRPHQLYGARRGRDAQCFETGPAGALHAGIGILHPQRAELVRFFGVLVCGEDVER